MAIAMFGLKACSTCVKAMKWMDEHGLAYEFSDYRDHPIAPDTLREWADQLGGWEKLVNRASLTWRNLPAERKAPTLAAGAAALPPEGARFALGRPGGKGAPTLAASAAALPPEGAHFASGRPGGKTAPGADEAWLALIAEFPTLVKRPVTMDEAGRVAVGFSDKAFSARFGQS